MSLRTTIFATVTLISLAALCDFTTRSYAQLPDKTVTPNAANVGINKSFAEQAGAGRGDVMTLDSSLFIIKRDPFRAIRRGVNSFNASTRDCRELDHLLATAPATSKPIWRSAPGWSIAARAAVDGHEAPPVLEVTL